MAQAQKSGHRFPVRIVAIIAVIVLLAAAAWYFTRPEPVKVVLAKVDRGTVEATVNNTRAGTIKACRRAKMSPAAGGQIVQLLVKKGQRVKAGQVLLRLWSKDLQEQERLSHQQLGTAQIQAFQSCAQADLEQRDADRARKLVDQGFISPEALDQKISAAKVSRTACEAAQSMIDQSHTHVAQSQADLDRMVLRAPFNGVVADISGELGEYATPSPPGIPTIPAIDLIDDSCMFVSAPIDEVDADLVKVGQQSRITLDAIKGKDFAGTVQRIAPYVIDLEKQARTVEVEVAFDPPRPDNLLVGYSADVEIIHDAHRQVLRIPTQALLEGKRVLLYRPDGVLEERSVATGLSNWDYTEIVSGLNQGDRVVISLDREGVKAGVRAIPEAGK